MIFQTAERNRDAAVMYVVQYKPRKEFQKVKSPSVVEVPIAAY